MNLRFENDVKMYGIQTVSALSQKDIVFENDVKMYGIQTLPIWRGGDSRFENDVKMYGIQTDWCPLKPLPEFEYDVKT